MEINNFGKLNRRDLLKIMALLPVSIAVKPLSKIAQSSETAVGHILLMVFDAWAAKNVSLYGYPRNTMPNLEKFAKKAIVYNQHNANGNYTIPGTASLLTGVSPWEHRALNLGGLINKKYADKQIFNVLSPRLDTIGFSQNVYADQLMNQAGDALKNHLPQGSFNLNDELMYDSPLFEKDAYTAFSSLEDGIFQIFQGTDRDQFLLV
jgi:hypothetical protein